jgi:hypothetical protein
MRRMLGAAIVCAWLLPASASGQRIANCVEVLTVPNNHDCHIATTVAGVPVGVQCVTVTFWPNPWSSNQASRCTITVAARSYDVQNCQDNNYDPGPGGGDNATQYSNCRSGTSGASYTCNYQDSTPTTSGPPSVYYRETCVLRTALLQLSCGDDYTGGGPGYFTHDEDCSALVQTPRVSVYVACDRDDAFLSDQGSTSQETCTGRLVTGLVTATCTVTPLVDPLYIYFLVKGAAPPGGPLNDPAAPTCHR